MHYFTKEEAEKIHDVLKKHIGNDMIYAPDTEVSKVIDVSYQETPHEIVNNGNIEKGYIVSIAFEKHSGLVPALFCSFNNLPVISATHEVLNTGKKSQLITHKNIIGEWAFKNEENYLQISIKDKTVNISGAMKGENINEKFSTSARWFSYYSLIFSDSPTYQVSYANEGEMEFSKLQSSDFLEEKVEWSVKLFRV